MSLFTSQTVRRDEANRDGGLTICFTSLGLTRRFKITDLTSIAPRTTVPAANVLPSPLPAEHQPQPTGAPNPPSGRLAGTTPAHRASQSGATALAQTSDNSTAPVPDR